MKSIGVYISLVVIMLLFGGCHREMVIQTTCTHYNGISLYSNDDGIHYSGTISKEATYFEIYSHRPLTRVMVDRVVCVAMNGGPELEGYWGKIIVSHSNDLYLYQFNLTPNNDTKDRNFQFDFGSGDTFCVVKILQQCGS